MLILFHNDEKILIIEFQLLPISYRNFYKKSSELLKLFLKTSNKIIQYRSLIV